MSSSGVDDLAEAVAERRAELGLSQRQLAAEAGVNKDTVQDIEGRKGRRLQRSTKQKLEDALGWERGGIDDVLRQLRAPRPATNQSAPLIDHMFDPGTVSNEELGRYADMLSEQAGDPVVGVRWMMGIQQKRLSVETSHNDDTNDQRSDTG